LRALLGAQDLLDGARAPRAGLDGGVVRHDAHHPSLDGAAAGDHAVGGEPLGPTVGEEGVLHEGPRIEQARDAVPREELAALRVLLVIAGVSTGPRALDQLP